MVAKDLGWAIVVLTRKKTTCLSKEVVYAKLQIKGSEYCQLHEVQRLYVVLTFFDNVSDGHVNSHLTL